MQLRCSFEGCDKQFRCKAELNDHINSHLGLKPFKCEICGKSFSSKRYLRAHMESHGDPVICEKCGITFTRRYRLKCHIEKYCQIKYECGICNKKYKKKGCYEAHITKCFKADKVKKLDKTTNKTDKVKKLDKTTNKVDRAKTATCEICKSVFSAKKNLLIHQKSVHEGIKYECKICHLKYSHNSSLKRHYEKSHSKKDEP